MTPLFTMLSKQSNFSRTAARYFEEHLKTKGVTINQFLNQGYNAQVQSALRTFFIKHPGVGHEILELHYGLKQGFISYKIQFIPRPLRK